MSQKFKSILAPLSDLSWPQAWMGARAMQLVTNPCDLPYLRSQTKAYVSKLHTLTELFAQSPMEALPTRSSWLSETHVGHRPPSKSSALTCGAPLPHPHGASCLYFLDQFPSSSSFSPFTCPNSIRFHGITPRLQLVGNPPKDSVLSPSYVYTPPIYHKMTS